MNTTKDRARQDYQRALERLNRVAPEFGAALPDASDKEQLEIVPAIAAPLAPVNIRIAEAASEAPGARPDVPTRTRPSMKGFGRVYPRGTVWWIEYWHRNQQYRESSKSPRRVDAERLLKRRLQEIGCGLFIGPSEDRMLLTDLLDAVRIDYEVNGRRSLPTLGFRLAPLRAAFAGARALDVTEPRIERYKAARLAEGLAAATVNRELAALRRAFRLGVKQHRVSRAPDISMLAEAQPREGFVEPNQFKVLVPHLAPYLQDFVRFAYIVGWRKGALKSLRWSDVDRENRRVYLRRAGSKNKKPYVIVLTGELAAIIERCWGARKVTRADGTTALSEFVFHRGDGASVGDFRKAWRTACEKAGTPALLFHDLRRSAARNLRRAGVDTDVAKKITGHETDSMWRRYSIVKEDDIEQALTATQAYVGHRAAEQADTRVLSMPEVHAGVRA